MKTAMQELMQWMEETEFMVNVGFIDKVNECLEKEKEQIMNANIEGTEHGYRERALFGLDARPYSKKRAEQYYNQTYNK